MGHLNNDDENNMEFEALTGLEDNYFPEEVMEEARQTFIKLGEGELGDKISNLLGDEESTLHIFLYTILRDSLIQGVIRPLMEGKSPMQVSSIRDKEDGTPIYGVSAECLYHILVDCVLMGMHVEKQGRELNSLWDTEREDVIYGD